MEGYCWETKGICLTAPLSGDVGLVAEFIDQKLAPAGINLIVLQVRYRYRFESHPECRGYDPLSREDIKLLLSVCRKHAIRLVPKMNLLGHQSGRLTGPHDGILHGYPGPEPHQLDGLLSAYPEFDETPWLEEVSYCRHLCLTNPKIFDIVFDLMDELIAVFEADGMHIGCDEAFQIGLCRSCQAKENGDLFGDYVTKLANHLLEQGKQVYMWGDRLLNKEETGYSSYESAENHTEGALLKIPKEIILCDWHYEKETVVYPSLKIFKDAGFRILLSPWKDIDHAVRFMEYALAHDEGNIDGVLATTWCSSGDLAGHILHGKDCCWENTAGVAEVLHYLYGI